MEASLRGKATVFVLRKRINDYHKKLESISDQAVIDRWRTRLRAAKELLANEGVEHLPSPEIFVSYDFKHKDLYALLSTPLKASSCRIIDGQDPAGDDNFRNVIRDKDKTV